MNLNKKIASNRFYMRCVVIKKKKHLSVGVAFGSIENLLFKTANVNNNLVYIVKYGLHYILLFYCSYIV